MAEPDGATEITATPERRREIEGALDIPAGMEWIDRDELWR